MKVPSIVDLGRFETPLLLISVSSALNLRSFSNLRLAVSYSGLSTNSLWNPYID